jgi:hypothetical protein
MDIQSPPPGERGSNTGRLAGATSNTDNHSTQQERRHKVVNTDAANAATKHMTQNAHWKIVHKTGSRKNQKQHVLGCECNLIKATGGQWIVECGARVHRVLRNKFIAARNGKPPWLAKALVRTVHEIEHHDIVSSGILADEFPDKHPRQWQNRR